MVFKLNIALAGIDNWHLKLYMLKVWMSDSKFCAAVFYMVAVNFTQNVSIYVIDSSLVACVLFIFKLNCLFFFLAKQGVVSNTTD